MLSNADPSTFSVLTGGRYTKDRSHVWIYTQLIPEANAATFTVTGQDGSEGHDKNHVYLMGSVVK
jgi:hypothetical protein